MVFGRAKGEKNMSKDEKVEVPVEKKVEKKAEAPVVEVPKKPVRKEPESNVEVGTSGATIEVPLNCGDKPEADALLNQMAVAKALAASKASKVIKAVRNSKTIAKEGRPVLDMAAKKVVVELTFEPAIGENFVKAAQEAV